MSDKDLDNENKIVQSEWDIADELDQEWFGVLSAHEQWETKQKARKEILNLRGEIERLRAALREIENAPWDTEMVAIARTALKEE